MSDEAWRLRFWSIFLGQALSLVGSAITQFVLLWWITDKTGSAAALATAGMAMLLPQAVLGPLGGVFADRHDRQIIMILTDLVSALCVLLLIMMFEYGNVELWQIYVLMATRSAMQAFQGPATMASVATLVPPDFVPRAAGFNQTVQGLSMVGAAPLGALLLSFVPVKYALGVDVLTAAIGISPLLFVTIPPVISTSSRHVRIWAQFRDGIQRIWSDRSLRGLYMLVTITTMFFMPLFTMIPLLVKSRYHGGASPAGPAGKPDGGWHDHWRDTRCRHCPQKEGTVGPGGHVPLLFSHRRHCVASARTVPRVWSAVAGRGIGLHARKRLPDGGSADRDCPGFSGKGHIRSDHDECRGRTCRAGHCQPVG